MSNSYKEVSPFELKVHHVRFAVEDVNTFSSFLVHKLNFKLFAKKIKSCEEEREVGVYKHGSILILVQTRQYGVGNSQNMSDTLCDNVFSYPVDTAYDVCLECSNIRKISDNSGRYKNSSVCGVKQVSDKNGTVQYTRLKSPIGNLQHTLLDLSNYQGSFLPGFITFPSYDSHPGSTLISLIDHIALCVRTGETDSLVAWYSSCFGFKRALINQNDNAVDGFKVEQNSNGLRLKEVVCPSTAQHTRYIAGGRYTPGEMARFVFAEPLTNEGDQTSLHEFMENHGGPGVQHIAFGCTNLFAAAKTFSKTGLVYVQYPPQYYVDLGKSSEMTKLKIDVDELRDNQALLEFHNGGGDGKLVISEKHFESCLDKQLETIESSDWYIMQVFTKPIFKQKTLFFEIIQRHNTIAGLGASNISTIWKYTQPGVVSDGLAVCE